MGIAQGQPGGEDTPQGKDWGLGNRKGAATGEWGSLGRGIF